LKPVVNTGGVPVFCNVLWPTREEALGVTRGDISLRFCEACGLMHNATFDPELVRYSPGYENSLHFSPTFRDFASGLAERLIARHGLHGKRIVDIGCGNGDFLRLLCEGTGNVGFGFDPSYNGNGNGTGDLTFVREHFSREHASLEADFICCRHVLEHLDEPRALLQVLEGNQARLYFEVPDGEYMLRETASWDVIYEHVSYFTAPTIRRLFRDFGFEALDVGSCFGDQYLYIEAAPASSPGTKSESPVELVGLVEHFAERYAQSVNAWAARLHEFRDAGLRVAVWGAGSKGVTFLNVVPGGREVELVVDLNVRKHGRFVPGTGQRVERPEAAGAVKPDVVIAMNPLYVDEIRARLQKLSVGADVLPV